MLVVLQLHLCPCRAGREALVYPLYSTLLQILVEMKLIHSSEWESSSKLSRLQSDAVPNATRWPTVTIIHIYFVTCYLLPALFPVAPKIDRKHLQSRKIKVGQTLKLEADVKGEPEPTITWTFKDQTLKSTEKLKIENADYHTSFSLQKLTREDGGKYVVTAKNDSGTDSVEIEITVVSKPSKPKGPLKVGIVLMS